MPRRPSAIWSALVVMATPEPTREPGAREAAPPAEWFEEAARYFRAEGFDTDQPVGISFSITGPPALFRRLFGRSLDPKTDRELSLSRLPPSLRSKLLAVTFTAPPDFGPSGDGP